MDVDISIIFFVQIKFNNRTLQTIFTSKRAHKYGRQCSKFPIYGLQEWGMRQKK
jgi:hypothetical protein